MSDSIDPQMAAVLDQLALRTEGQTPIELLSPAAARAQTRENSRIWNTGQPAMTAVRDAELPGPHGPIPVRLYDPGAGALAPCVVYIHGGGWVICDLDTHDSICRRLAAAGGFRVASVDYRLAPEHKFPVPLDDCVAALSWLGDHGAEWGIDPSRLAVAGDSAGANLALAACLALRDRRQTLPRAAALVYGAYSADLDTPSHCAYGDGQYILSAAAMRWFWDHYTRDTDDHRNPLIAPLHADLTGLPPLLITAAALDPLLDDTERLVARLARAGVEHRYRLWPGVTHACLHMAAAIDSVAAEIDRLATDLAQRLTP